MGKTVERKGQTFPSMAPAGSTANPDPRHQSRADHRTAHHRTALAWAFLLVMSAAVLSAISLKAFPSPFLWTGWEWTIALLLCAQLLKTGLLRVVAFNLAVLAGMLASTETYFSLREPIPPAYSDPYILSDDVLGTAPAKGVQAHSSEFKHGRRIFDTAYTIGPNGLRIAPPAPAGAAPSILFFGCSFTFGEGLQDDQTLPYQVGVQSGESYQTYNFGFHGYGPQQMLAWIESGGVDQLVKVPPRYAIYEALPDHVARVAGKTPYGRHSPRYEMDADGNVHLNGHFDDGKTQSSGLNAHLLGQLHKSATYRVLSSLEPPITDDDIKLLLATVRKSRDLLVAENPGIEFHVILWRNFDYEERTYRKLQAGFKQMNVPVHLVENILPDYNHHPERYWLSLDDRHPDALADRLIAHYVVTQILANPGSQSSIPSR